MFRAKRGDTLVRTFERQHGIDLNVRSDALLGNLLADRGFDSATQLLRAYRLKATTPARRRRVFISFHEEDLRRVQGFRLMCLNPGLELDIYDSSLRVPVASENARSIRNAILYKLRQASVVICLVGDGTGWREWVDWELEQARTMGKGLCAVRINGTYGRVPRLLRELDSPFVSWNAAAIVAAIECAAARRS